MDHMSPFRPGLNRRKFLKIAGVTGVTAALGHLLFTYAPWLDYDAQIAQTWARPLQITLSVPEQLREFIRYAMLAANGHNAQPWKFAAQADTIRIYPDASRRLPVVDPADRELWISLGCALENLLIAARSAGYEGEVTYPLSAADPITVQLKPTATPNSNPLCEAIPHRQSTRSLYDGRSVSLPDLRRIDSIPLEASVSTQIFTAPDQIEAILEYLKAGDQRQYSDAAFISELIAWLRFNPVEAFETLDGLFTRCSSNPEVPRWLGELFVTTASAGQQTQTDERNVRSSAGLLLIVSEQDDRRAWIDTGRVAERQALTLTSLNIKSAFINQPIEVAELRSEFQNYLNLGSSRPQILLRFGYANPMPHSLRRPVEQVLA